jgi:hypothetical protein
MKITLEYPIAQLGADGKLIETTVVEFPDRLQAKHLKFMPKAFINGGTEVEPHESLPFIAGVLGLSNEAAEQIDFKDVLKIMGMLPSFLEELLQDKTSEQPSGT